MSTIRGATLFVAAIAVSASCSGQSAFKCGEVYSQQPCPGGQPVRTDDPRAAEQARQAQANTRRDAQLAEDMRKARLKQEANAAPAFIPAPRVDSEAPKSSAPVWVKPDKLKREPKPFTAIKPGPKKDTKAAKKKEKAKKPAKAPA